MTIAETDDVGPNIEDDDYITVKLFWQLWDKVPRQDASNPSNILFYEDYDIGYNQQTVNWKPMALAGPPGVEFLEAGQAQISFIGERSYALAPGATLSSYLWTAHGSSEGTSSSQGTEGSPVTFTWTAAGQYLVTLKVTDSNGIEHTNYTWAIVIDPADPTAVAYTDFDAISDSFDFNQGGGSCNFTVRGTADISQFPTETLVLHVARGTQTTPTATWPNRSNILYAGYITGNGIRQDPVANTTSFRTVSIDGLMKKLSIYPVRLSDSSNPQNWTQAKDLTVDRVLSFLAHWRSTLSLMTNVRPLEYTAELKSQDFNKANLFGMFKSLMGDAWGLPVSDHQSVLHLVRDFNLMTTTERAAATTRKTLHKGLWVAVIDIAERGEYEQPVRKIKWNGVYYPGDGAAAIPLFSEAPGDVMDSWGNEQSRSGLILTTQADLNTRTGYAYSRANQRYPGVSMRFLNDGSFTVAPQEIFPANIEAADNNRGLVWTPDLIPRSIRRTYNHEGGYIDYQVSFEPSVTGPAAATVTMPAKPASATGGGVAPSGDPPPAPPAWTQPTVPVSGPAVAADTSDGVYITFDSGASWAERNNLLSSPDQLAMQYLIWDPWWFTPEKQGTNDPEQVILWGCGLGFVVKSDDAGKSWQVLTQNIDDPENVGGDSPAPTAETVTYTIIRGDIHHKDTFYFLAIWENTANEWRTWTFKIDDDGVTWISNPTFSLLPLSFVITHDDTGDLSEWTATSTSGGGTVAASMAAGLNGTAWGLATSLTGALGEEALARKDFVAVTGTQYTFSWWFDPNSLTMPDITPPDFSQEDVTIMQLVDQGDPSVFRVALEMQNSSGVFNFLFRIKDDSLTIFSASVFTVTNEPHLFQVVVNKATDGTSNDGSAIIKVDGATKGTISDLDLFTRYSDVDRVEFGCIGVSAEAGISGTIYTDQITMQVTEGFSTASQVYGMSLTSDSETGESIYVTSWKDGSIYLERLNTSLVTQSSLIIGTATIGQITARTFFASVLSAAFFGSPILAETIYIYGRWTDGTVSHVAKSIDGGLTIIDIGDSATWLTGWVGGFLAVDANTLFALVNDGGSSALYRTIDGGTIWTQLSLLPFEVDPGGVSGHPDGRILISNRDAGGQTAAYAEAPDYSSWIDATGAPSFPASTPGNGSNAIIWIV
jgi:hypothetical protein